MGFDLPPETTTQFRELILERMKVAAEGRVGGHTLKSVELHQWVDHMSDRLAYRLTAEVLAERVMDQNMSVPWQGEGTGTARVRRMRGLAFPFILAGTLGLAGAFATSLILVIAAFTVAALAGLLLYLNPAHEIDVTVPVAGTLNLQSTHWRKFPEASFAYPRRLGRPVMYTAMEPPTFEQR